MSVTRIVFLCAALFLLSIGVRDAALAQSYPTKPVRLIVSFPAGGGSDVIGRIVGQKLGDRFGQQVVVDNRPGAGGSIGTEIAAKSAPDGYTLLLGSTSEIGINPSLYTRLPYDVLRDLAPVAGVASTPMVLLVHPSLPVKTPRDLVALAKAKPGQINYASAGNGTSTHMSAELFRYLTGIKIVHVPYKGAPPALVDLASGEVQLMFSTLPAAMAFIKAGKVKPIGISSRVRASSLPNVPTMIESGIKDYEVEYWYGLFFPAGTPKPIIDRVFNDVAALLKSPDTVAKLASQGAQPMAGSQAEFSAFVRADVEKWAKVVKASGARLD